MESEDNDPDNLITDADVQDVVAKLTEDDIRERSQALHEAQETWEELQFLSTPKMPCRECGGSGSVGGGSFGTICVGCMGERMVAMPGAPEFEMPNFAAMRSAIGAYGDALAFDDPKKRALPAPSSVPTMADIQRLKTQALERCNQLQLGGAPVGTFDPKQLPEGRPERGLAGEGDLGEYEDAELDEIEDAARAERARRGRR